jgi:hypothetical protein
MFGVDPKVVKLIDLVFSNTIHPKEKLRKTKAKFEDSSIVSNRSVAAERGM